jgi:hypothetical protein
VRVAEVFTETSRPFQFRHVNRVDGTNVGPLEATAAFHAFGLVNLTDVVPLPLHRRDCPDRTVGVTFIASDALFLVNQHGKLL